MSEQAAERRLGTRYRIDEPDGSWWELGWDRPLATFYAQHYSPVPFDPFTEDELQAWHGTDFAELPTLGALASRLPIAVPEEVAQELTADAWAFPNMGPPPFLADARRLAEILGAAADPRHAATPPVPTAAPAATAPTLPEAQEPPTGPQVGLSLPAAPLAGALRHLHADPFLADDDLGTFATGLGLDPQLARGVLDGSVQALDVGQIAEVCEALRCTPDDVWGPALSRQIAHAYGPADWPHPSEPILDPGVAMDAHALVARQGRTTAFDAVAVSDIRDTVPGRPADAMVRMERGERLAVLATCYSQVGVLAVDAAGNAATVDDLQARPDPNVDYHCQFRQVTSPDAIAVAIDNQRFIHGPGAGRDSEPALASAATKLRNGAWPAPIDMVRFTAADSGVEQWLGWEYRTASWQTWDDPRRYYAGDPSDVLDPAGLTDPRGSCDLQQSLDASSMDGADRYGDEVEAVDLGTAAALDL